MDRAAFFAALAAYVPEDDSETASLARIRTFVAGPADPFDRSTPEGHVTGSAVVARPDGCSAIRPIAGATPGILFSGHDRYLAGHPLIPPYRLFLPTNTGEM